MEQYYIQPPLDQSDSIFKLLLDPAKIEEQYIIPSENGFKASLLDDHLALGYYRMQNFLFTTSHFQDGFYGKSMMIEPVFWLRTLVNKISEKKAALTIRKKCKAFTISFKKACINEEIEKLYCLYRNHIHFKRAENCIDIFDTGLIPNPFDSWMIEVRDGDLLIAVGYFDKGKDAIMGILNIYHPDYKRYSLGKYLMLKKIDYAITNGIAFYYTGYISTSNTKFDYKVFPDENAVEVFLPIEKLWMPGRLYTKSLLFDYFMENVLGIKWEES